MNIEPIIRTAKCEDIPQINDLLYQVHKVHSDLRPDIFKSGSKKYNEKQLKQIIDDKNRPIFLAENQNKILGYAFCVIIDYSENLSLCPIKTLYIDDLCVTKNSRKSGIGNMLFNYVSNYAKSIGCYNVTLNVWEGNDGALAFYKKVGLKPQKTGMEIIL